MSEAFIAEIRIFPFNFAPKGWAQCNGQLMAISQNTALFSLLGTTYGGDGRSTFALPNLQGSVPMHPGQGPGLSGYVLGETTGTENVTLLQQQLPAHTHTVQAASDPGESDLPTGKVFARSAGGPAYAPAGGGTVPFSPQAVSAAGSTQPHNNMQPYLTVNFCIALQGIFPPRS